MSLTRAIAGNSILQISGKLLATILGILTVGVMTRHLGQAGYGQFTTAISFLQFFGILADFGLMLTMIRMLSNPTADNDRVASNIFTMRLAIAVGCFTLATIIGFLAPYPLIIKLAIAVGSLSFLFMSLAQLLVGVFQKNLAAGRAALAEVAGRAVLLGGTIAVIAWGGNLIEMMICLVVGNAVQFIISYCLSRRYFRLRLSFDWLVWRGIMKESWPIAISIAFNLIYLRGDVLVMSFSRPAAEIGLYGAAYKFLDVATIVPMVLMGMTLSALSSAWQTQDTESFRRRLNKIFDATSIVALPLAIATFTVADDLMVLLAGPDFAAAGQYLIILMLAAAAVFWSTLFGHAIVALGKQRQMIWAYAIDAAISIALYLILIPHFGALAAAWVTFFSEAFIAVITAIVTWRVAQMKPNFQIAGRALLASIAMTAAVALTGAWPVLLRLAFACIVYAIGLWLFRAIDKETLALLRRSNRV